MGEYFKPFRRGVGVVTLVMACVFMAGWVKSVVAIDIVVIPLGGKSAVTVFSEDQLFGVQYHFERLGLHSTTRLGWISDLNAHHISTNLYTDVRLTWHYRIWGFSCAEYLKNRANGCQLIFWLIPYWSFTIPLTLISLWLLLTKPRKSNQLKIAEPVPENVV